MSNDDDQSNALHRLTDLLDNRLEALNETLRSNSQRQHENFRALAGAINTLSEQIEVLRPA